MPAEEHDQVRSELRLQWPASVYTGSSGSGGWLRAPDRRRHRQLLGRSAGRAVPGRDVRLRVQFRRVVEFGVAENRLELAGLVGRTSDYLVHVCTVSLRSWRFRCLCIIDQWHDAVLVRLLWPFDGLVTSAKGVFYLSLFVRLSISRIRIINHWSHSVSDCLID